MMKVTNDFFKQFEELSIKLDKLLKENKNMITTHKAELKKQKQEFKTTVNKKPLLIN